MHCLNCANTGVIVKSIGMGIHSFGPCLECGIHLINKQRIEQERRELLARKNKDKTVKENNGAHPLVRRRKSRLPDWNFYQSERM